MRIDLSTLNPPQREAVKHNFGAMLVLAGAGSGKTRVVTTRIARLLQEGHSGRSILAVTFTNKAAKEMKERVLNLVERRMARGITVSTFHALCARILRKDAHRIELAGHFTILDAADQLAQLLRVAKEENVDLGEEKPAAVLSQIGHFKNQGWHPKDVVTDGNPANMLAARLYAGYASHLRQLAAVDFDDLLLLCRDLLRDVDDVRERYKKQFRFVLIDEYQDTNPLQLELLQLLVNREQNVCAVGDDDQAIYGFRGGDVANILAFDSHFPPCKVVKLEQNYRSTSNILNAANAVIRNNTVRKDKTLFSELGDGEKIRLVASADGESEATFIATTIVDMLKKGEVTPKDISLLYRANPQSRAFEEQLRLHGVPYKVIGGQEFYERKEVKDTLAYVSLMIRPDDELAFRRVVNLPARGLGEKAVQKVIDGAKERGLSLIEYGAAGSDGADLKAIQRATMKRFCTPLLEARERIAMLSLEDDIAETASRAAFAAGLQGAMNAEKDLKRRERFQESAEEVFNGLFAWTGRLLEAQENPDLEESWVVDLKAPPLLSFLDRIALEDEEREKARQKNRGDDEKKIDDRVTLMTFHRSKGLEFPVVFFVGFEEGIIPHRRTLDEGDPAGIEEERRLAYVGITRAQKQLIFTYAIARRRRRQMVPRTLCRFASEIPDEVMLREGMVAPPEEEDPAAGFFSAMKGKLTDP
ncbi:MAG: UvrD-helicase domain-containing protein [Deltaproteobacteria bacterium]|nr:UvrD-helicase domain-containing protein [Deltaproteobacteria bacterium]